MRLLIIGSLGGQIGAASQIAISRGAKVVHADSIETAMQSLRSGKGADLVMIDVGQDVARLVIGLEAERFSIPVVACGVGTDTRRAVQAIKAGAREYVPLPPDPDLIAAVIEAAVQESHAIVYRDPRMGEVLRLAQQVAASDASILVVGGSGCGKELLARFLHQKSHRKDGPFIAVNCAAIPENLLESELFGHEKGAFTGAVARRLGKFEEANGGTLLLDEISEMDIRLQAKLLRALQEREIDRVGGSHPVKVDVRIVATSNRNMEEEVAKGTFRQDLYFRINVMTLAIPDLRDRPQDIPVLAEFFVKKFTELNGVPARALAPETERLLMTHPWPGNVRELENTMHRAVLLAGGPTITPDAIRLTPVAPGVEAPGMAGQTMMAGSRARPYSQPQPQPQTSTQAGALVGRTVADVERQLIIDTLTHCLGNRTHAANILGISIRTLRNKLKQYTDEGSAIPQPGMGDRVAY